MGVNRKSGYQSLPDISHVLILDAVDPYTATDRAEFWRKAYNCAKEVYDAKVYTLQPNYANLWNCRTIDSDEIIFQLLFNEQTGGNNFGYSIIPGQSRYTPKGTTTNNNGRVRPTKPPYEWQKEKYSELDPRLEINYVTTEYCRNDLNTNTEERVFTTL